MTSPVVIEPVRILSITGHTTSNSSSNFVLKNDGASSDSAEVILDYGECEGGMPIFEVLQAASHTTIELSVVYSEGIEGIGHEMGDGPFFLFSNAMDTYRSTNLHIEPTTTPKTVKARYAQRSQRYQKITLKSSDTSITFSKVGFERVRPKQTVQSSFSCSDDRLNRIWRDGVKTVDMCTVIKGETAAAWEVTESGTRVHGQHWAPCRHGTRWGDKIVQFQVHIEKGGASWGVHMVANGLIFCLDAFENVLIACEGLAHESTIFPVAEKGRWPLDNISLEGWIDIKTITCGSKVTVLVQDQDLAVIEDLNIHPLLGGSPNNTGSIAFGGPCHWIAQYRHLRVLGPEDQVLYENDMLLQDRERTLADFQVGTNALSCTIDGAKRDRACFGGDLHVMGRSIAHSTMNFEAIAGSIELLTSHQASDGYLGNLCPIQAPEHDGEEEPPTYAFYSLTYALLLVVSIKDYWMHSGDEEIHSKCLGALDKLMSFAGGFVDDSGVLSAPPPLSMHWYPMGGPILGQSGPLNVAYFNALQAMATMSLDANSKNKYTQKAKDLEQNILDRFWDPCSKIFRLSNNLPSEGICQDVNAYAITTGLTSSLAKDVPYYADPKSDLPLAFHGLGHWDTANLVSPYASGFSVEALFSLHQGPSALHLIESVWGAMADPDSANYSGGHWEAMKPDGTPLGHDTSLIHGWSTWPVFLLPRYLAGLHPIEPGWKVFGIAPVLAGLDYVDCTLETVAGAIAVQLAFDESAGRGEIRLLVPADVRAQVQSPEGWVLQGPGLIEGTGDWIVVTLTKAAGTVNEPTSPRSTATSAASEQEIVGKPSTTRPHLERNNGLFARLLRRLSIILCR